MYLRSKEDLGSFYFYFVLDTFLQFWSFPVSSIDKESACNARDPGSIPGSRRFPGEGILGFPHGPDGKESASNVGDLSSIPGLGSHVRLFVTP